MNFDLKLHIVVGIFFSAELVLSYTKQRGKRSLPMLTFMSRVATNLNSKKKTASDPSQIIGIAFVEK